MKIEEFKAVIFDLDGTLLYTLKDLANAVNEALEHFEYEKKTIEQVRCYVGNGVRNLMIKAVPDGENNPKFEDIFNEFKRYYGIHCNDNTKPYDGIMEMLSMIKEKGIKTAIVSNKINSTVEVLANRFFDNLIDISLGESEGMRRKPAPDMIDAVIKSLEVSKDDCIYVGDSEVDLLTAAYSGISCVSVSWGFRDVEQLYECGAKYVIDHPKDIFELDIKKQQTGIEK